MNFFQFLKNNIFFNFLIQFFILSGVLTSGIVLNQPTCCRPFCSPTVRGTSMSLIFLGLAPLILRRQHGSVRCGLEDSAFSCRGKPNAASCCSSTNHCGRLDTSTTLGGEIGFNSRRFYRCWESGFLPITKESVKNRAGKNRTDLMRQPFRRVEIRKSF